MPDFLRLLRRSRRPEPPAGTENADADLERFFTDAEEARRLFEEVVVAKLLPRRILVIYGVGAVGKSSLLKMYRLFCRRQRVPVALVGGEDAPSAVDLLDRWAADLKGDGVDLPTFGQSLDQYRKVQAKVETEAHKAEVEGQLTKVAARGAVAAAAAIPGAGPVVAAVGPEAVESILNLIRATLSKADYDLFTDPTQRLSDDFLVDLVRAAEARRLVLMLDTCEQVAALSDWLLDFAQKLPENVLLVLAGQVIPEWDRGWPGWVARSETIELTEMSDEHVETLVRQYYSLFGRGDPTDAFVLDVVRFARGLPMAATTAVRLTLSYRLADLHATDAGIAAELADRLLEGVPVELRPVFEAAAALRYFNADSLAALLDSPDGSTMYDELRRWPFTRARREALAVHETMREVINAALRSRSPEQFRRLQERAVGHYGRLRDRAGGEDRDRLQLEWLYHSLRADEASAIGSFRQLAEELVRAQWIGRLRALVNDANTYPLELENSRLWRRYYAARLEQLIGHSATAETEYRAIADSEEAEPTLRAYALCDLGGILATLDRLAAPEGPRAAIAAAERSLTLQPSLDSKLVANHFTLMDVSNAQAAWDTSIEHIRAAREFAGSSDNKYALVQADRLQAALQGLQGDWGGFLRSRRQYLAVLTELGDVPALEMHVAYFAWPLVFMGRYAEAQASSEAALRLAVRLEETELMITIRETVALSLGMQGAYEAAATQFAEAYNFYENFHRREAELEAGSPDRYIRAMLSFRGLVALREGKLDQAEADLQRALSVKQQIGDRIGLPEVHVWLGQVHELRHAHDVAEADYTEALALRGVGRHYFHCAAITGLVRVRNAQGRGGECGPLLTEADELARRYEYHDLLASLHLSQAQLAWDGGASASEAVLAHYREALLHALRFNRFLLDEVLAGRREGTPFQPVIPTCLERGAEGRRVLAALRDWWGTGLNDGEARADAVSPLLLGLPLPEAERIARAREPGTRTEQPLQEQIESALRT